MQSRSPHVYRVPLDAFYSYRIAFAQGPLALGGKGRPDRAVDSDRAFVERAATRFDDRAAPADDRFHPRPEAVRVRRAVEESLEDRPRSYDQRDRDDQKDQRLRGEAAYAEHRHDRRGQRSDSEPEQEESGREDFGGDKDGRDDQPD